jgi:hypothetical protein
MKRSAAALSPTAAGRANIWLLDIRTKRYKNLTGLPQMMGLAKTDPF